MTVWKASFSKSNTLEFPSYGFLWAEKNVMDFVDAEEKG